MNPAAGWRYAYASVAGTSHRQQETPCQDASRCHLLGGGDGLLVAVAADGAGSAIHGDAGARIACETFLRHVESVLSEGGDVADITSDFAREWLSSFQNEVARTATEASDGGLTPRDYACTFLAAVLSADRSAFLQVGDGAIVVSGGDEDADAYRCVFWPQQGEYENVTNFATEPGAADLMLHAQEGAIYEAALFTDGLQRLALHFGSRTAFAPFFRPMFAPLRAVVPGGHAAELSRSLEAFLDSPAVNSRTDDDKTLILASRRTVHDDDALL